MRRMRDRQQRGECPIIGREHVIEMLQRVTADSVSLTMGDIEARVQAIVSEHTRRVADRDPNAAEMRLIASVVRCRFNVDPARC